MIWCGGMGNHYIIGSCFIVMIGRSLGSLSAPSRSQSHCRCRTELLFRLTYSSTHHHSIIDKIFLSGHYYFGSFLWLILFFIDGPQILIHTSHIVIVPPSDRSLFCRGSRDYLRIRAILIVLFLVAIGTNADLPCAWKYFL